MKPIPNEIELSVLYQKETGNRRPDFDTADLDEIKNYVEWLEEKIIL
jgi:hypothetical protein